jgi:hypothetical protein
LKKDSNSAQMTIQEEAQYIHDLLPVLLREPIDYDLAEYEFPADMDIMEVITNRLEEESIIRVPNSKNPFFLTLTTAGKRIAERPGGYLGYLAEQEQQQVRQQEAQAEKDRLERAADKATVSAAQAAWVAAVFSLLSIAISIFALYQTSQLGEAQRQITTLQKQVKRLSVPLVTPSHVH